MLNTQVIDNPNLKSSYELTYALCPWAWFSLGDLVSDHTYDGLSALNKIKGVETQPVRLVTDQTKLIDYRVKKPIKNKCHNLKVLLNPKQTTDFVAYCHSKGETVTSILTSLFRKPKTKVVIATNLRPRLKLPDESIGNLSSSISFKEDEPVTASTIRTKIMAGEDTNPIERLLNIDPERLKRMAWLTNNITRFDFRHPKLAISNLGVHTTDRVPYLYFMPLASPYSNMLTLSVITVNGRMGIVLSSVNKIEYTAEEVRQKIENIARS